MIVLDTNVLSELSKQIVNPAVKAWADDQSFETLYSTSISEAEMRYGVALLSPGRRRDALLLAVDVAFGTLLANRILPFDRQAARVFGEWAAQRRRAGRPVTTADLQIAAIARARGAAAIATRNIADFEGCRVALIDPWAAGAA